MNDFSVVETSTTIEFSPVLTEPEPSIKAIDVIVEAQCGDIELESEILSIAVDEAFRQQLTAQQIILNSEIFEQVLFFA